MQEKRRQSKAEKHAITRAALLATARRLFAAKGYAETGTEEVVAEAGVTRGALYYHFTDKRALFEAVVESVAQEVLNAIEAAAGQAKTPAEALIKGTTAFLDACLEPAARQIFLIDAPSVLGWKRWREIDARYGGGSLRMGIEAALEALPKAQRLSADALTYLLTGAMNEAALWLAEAENEAAARKAADAALKRILELLFDPER
ncbi:TetR/AcrR family transcriptional regulator [uncultured Ferrovibrio sp.]|jgi:AcrR family transcriptional regulator|uniref:TetR/AcrR family transcriptional regulator n=1 Tax=uncultured Ferrovibrio sp. TaxID=1576913 RepID=UPI002613EE20|nr:TetR/AcrR family transcriptional regulator [uncultured Ferrovibrio sp.]